MTIRNVLAAALLAATAPLVSTGGAASAACEPLTERICPGTIRDPDDLYCWRDPSRIPGIYCRW